MSISNRINLSSLSIVVIISLLFCACNKYGADDYGTVSISVTDITYKTATAVISLNTSLPVEEFGDIEVIVSTQEDMSVNLITSRTNLSESSYRCQLEISGLTVDRDYYAKAYIYNNAGKKVVSSSILKFRSGGYPYCIKYTTVKPGKIDPTSSSLKSAVVKHEYDVVTKQGILYFFVMPSSLSDAFKDQINYESIDISGLDTSSITDMSGMFDGCTQLTSISLGEIKTSNVINMSRMFTSCKQLKSLDLSSFDTSKVKDFKSMFAGLESLTSLDLSNFDTSSAVTMFGMLGNLSSIKNLDVSSFDTSNVEDMTAMFYGDKNLQELDITNFNTTKVKSFSGFLHGCSSLVSIDLSSLDTSNCESFNSMFWGCSSLEQIDLSNFNTIKVNEMPYMFKDCKKLKSIDVTNFNFGTDLFTSVSYHMFDGTLVEKLKVPQSFIKDAQFYFDTFGVIESSGTIYIPSGVPYYQINMILRILEDNGGKWEAIEY